MPVVKYNGYTLPFVYDKFFVAEDEKVFRFSCTFLITKGTSSSLVTECQTAEEKLTEINKNFELRFGGSLEFNFSHAGNTGFLARPTLTKVKGIADTGTSRAYKFKVNIELPFEQTPYNYRRKGSFSVEHANSRQRIVTFKMEYTAGGVNSAFQNYNAATGGKSWASTVLISIGGNFELITERWSEEHEEKILNAVLKYKEILSDQSAAVVDHAAIINPSCTYSVDFDQEIGISQTAGYKMYPLTTVRINYSGKINKELKADTEIEDVYNDHVKPWLIEHSWKMLGLANNKQASKHYIVQKETKTINPYDYTVSGSLVFIAPKSGTAILELGEMITERKESGIVTEKLWDEEDNTYNIYSIGGRITLQRIVVILKLNSEPKLPKAYIVKPQLEKPQNGSWKRLYIDKKREVKEFGSGTKDTRFNTTLVHAVTFIEQYIWVVPVKLQAIQEIPGGENYGIWVSLG